MSESQPLVPPYSKESEMMVLGCMLNSPHAFSVGATSLYNSDFYLNEHKSIFNILFYQFKNNKPADISLVSEELRRRGQLESAGSTAYLTSLAQYAGTSGFIEEYCKLLKEKAFSRQSINLLQGGISALLKDPDTPQLVMDDLYQRGIELGKGYSSNDKASLGDILRGLKSRIDNRSALERIQRRFEYFKEHRKPFITGLPTGLKDLDHQVTLLEDTHLVVVAGRPGTGKTAFVLNICAHLCLDLKIPVGFISLEMGADQLAERVLALRGQVSGEKIKRGTLEPTELKQLEEVDAILREAPLFIHDAGVSSIHQVIAKARRLKEEDGIKLLAVDYLQLLGASSKSESRQYEVAEVSRRLKQLAMELKIPVLCIAQLSRKVEERQGKKPLMSDLRDSGQIEQDSDAILFLFRRDYYDPKDHPGEVELIVAKNRHGSTLEVSVAFRKDCGLFMNLIRTGTGQSFPKGFQSSEAALPWNEN